jgi:hypothetical protein
MDNTRCKPALISIDDFCGINWICRKLEIID